MNELRDRRGSAQPDARDEGATSEPLGVEDAITIKDIAEEIDFFLEEAPDTDPAPTFLREQYILNPVALEPDYTIDPAALDAAIQWLEDPDIDPFDGFTITGSYSVSPGLSLRTGNGFWDSGAAFQEAIRAADQSSVPGTFATVFSF